MDDERKKAVDNNVGERHEDTIEKIIGEVTRALPMHMYSKPKGYRFIRWRDVVLVAVNTASKVAPNVDLESVKTGAWVNMVMDIGESGDLSRENVRKFVLEWCGLKEEPACAGT